MTRFFCMALLLAGLLAGCGTAPEVTGNDAVIVHIQRHDATISVRATPTGLVYDVNGPGGLLQRGMREAEFEAAHPDLYRFYRQSTAGPLDASLTLPEATQTTRGSH